MYSILAQAQPGNSYMPFFILAFAVIFYFFMIRPQQKKQKEAKKFIEDLKKGDYVVTIGGAHGYIGEMEGDTFILEVEKGGRIKFNKSAISAEATKAANKK
ncbi:MAG: preprotein translocase subunit YajC [Chryseolinea sp.]